VGIALEPLTRFLQWCRGGIFYRGGHFYPRPLFDPLPRYF
jgi:hypothetical protein